MWEYVLESITTQSGQGGVRPRLLSDRDRCRLTSTVPVNGQVALAQIMQEALFAYPAGQSGIL